MLELRQFLWRTAVLEHDLAKGGVPVCPSVRPSVCLSITRWYSLETNDCRIKRFLRSNSPETPVF